MSVAYILKSYPRYSETFIVNEILAHEKAGLEIRIFSLMPPRDEYFQDIISRVKAPVKYLTAKARNARDFWALQGKASGLYPDLWKALSENPDVTVDEATQAMELAVHIKNTGVTHLHAHFASTATTVARVASAITGIPYSFTAHAKDIFRDDNDFDALRTKFEDASAAITVSDFNLRYLRQDLGIRNPALGRVFNGLDLNDFRFAAPAERPPAILAVGRLVEKKGFGDLLTACRILRDSGTEFTCLLVGAGEFQTILETQIADLGLSDIVTMLGPRPQAEIKTLLTNAAMFVAPCIVGEDGDRDGLPTVLLEAMALGTPCISTDVTGIPEVLIHEKTGLMVPQRNPAELAEAIQRLLADRDLGRRLARSARQMIEAEFDIHKNAETIRRHIGDHILDQR